MQCIVRREHEYATRKQKYLDANAFARGIRVKDSNKLVSWLKELSQMLLIREFTLEVNILFTAFV